MKKITYRTEIFSIAGKACLLFAAAYLLLPSSINAQCGKWDVSGHWSAVFPVDFSLSETVDITQSGKSISGRATDIARSVPYRDGVVKGTVDGDNISFTTDWKRSDGGVQGKTEFFNGKIGANGTIQGTAFLLLMDKSLDWSSSERMKCRYKTIHRLKIKPATPTVPVGPGPVTLKAPGIIASPNNIALVTGESTGKTTLTWDAGKDHPYAEVWVKVDGQDETKVLEQGKGTLQVTVVPGKTYIYMLEDAGKTLATVTVKFYR